MTRGRQPPLTLLAGPVPDTAWRAPLEAAGWQVHDALDPLGRPAASQWPSPRPPIVLVVSLRDRSDVERILQLVIDGFGVVCRVDLADPLAAELHEDLRRLGSVAVLHDGARVATDASAVAHPDPVVDRPDAETLAILQSLSEGRTLGEAARSVNVSRRTADRRLAEVRRALGVATTVEAVVAGRRAGWLETGPG